MEKNINKIKVQLEDCTNKRDALVKELVITKRSLKNYILDCKDWDEPLNPITVSDLESKISEIQAELKKLNSKIFKYELAIERFGG